MRVFRYISILFCLLVVGFYIYQNAPHYQIIKGKIFGSYYNIKIRTNNKNKLLEHDIKEELERLNDKFSVFTDKSEISAINRAEKQTKLKLSDDMRNVLKASDKIYHQSAGWFDPSLGKIIDLWGFGTEEAKAPSAAKIKQAMRSVGFNKIKFSRNYSVARKSISETKLNLSAIAKGYAVDKIAALLDSKGYNHYLVEIGGEIKAKGFRAEPNEAWSIGINAPLVGSHENIMILSLSNLAVATSGDYRNFYVKDGKTFAHTISSKTGKPALSDALSVSVFHDSCMYADAYATAIMAMGLEKGMAFADKNKLKVIIYDNNFTRHISKAAHSIFTE